MFLWFAGAAVAVTWAVFKSPGLDYRLVAFGAVVPSVEVVAGSARVLHTLIAAVVALGVVVVVTTGRRLLRRRLLGIPIGLFLHLVLDGAFADPDLFWWPVLGDGLGGETPESGRGAFVVVLEGAGLVALAWVWHRFDLHDPARRRALLRTGRLPRLPER